MQHLQRSKEPFPLQCGRKFNMHRTMGWPEDMPFWNLFIQLGQMDRLYE